MKIFVKASYCRFIFLSYTYRTYFVVWHTVYCVSVAINLVTTLEMRQLIQFVKQVLYLISAQNRKHIWTFFSILISDAESGREKQGVQISWRCPFISGKIFPITVILLLHIYTVCSTGNNIHHVNTYWPVLVIIEDLCYIVDTIIIHYC